MAKHLIRRGNQWYLHVAIPRPLRQHFLSESGRQRDAIWEALGPNLDDAKPISAERVAVWEQVFSRLRAGEKLSPEAIKAIVSPAQGEAEFSNMLVRRLVRHHNFEPSIAKIIVERLATAEQHNPTDPQGLDVPRRVSASTGGETINQAADAWLDEMARTDVRKTTIDGHRDRVKAFIDHAGDVELASVTRAKASDWLAHIAKGRSNRTTNNYSVTMKALFDSAKQRGRFTGENPFANQKRKADGESYAPFTAADLQTLFTALPREIKPARHSPETALPWVALIGAYTGMRLEEVAQLTVADIKTLGQNGGTLVCFDIHNGDDKRHLKNKSSARVVPVHSELVRAGFLDYVKALPQDGLLFPGLKRRASKGDKIGARLGELFRKRLVALEIKRPRICFHSFRHTVGQRFDAAGVVQTDAARITGHTIEGMTYGTYSTGPGLARLKVIVEQLRYDDVPILTTAAGVSRRR
jgi:integrase